MLFMIWCIIILYFYSYKYSFHWVYTLFKEPSHYKYFIYKLQIWYPIRKKNIDLCFTAIVKLFNVGLCINATELINWQFRHLKIFTAAHAHQSMCYLMIKQGQMFIFSYNLPI